MALITIQIIAVLGFLLSWYALHIEKKSEKDANYKPVCDITEKANCSTVISSEYGKIGGISNSLGGLGFYALIFILGFFNFGQLIFYLAIASILGSIYLAYIQYFKLKTICFVCSSIYAVNILLVIYSYLAR